MGTIQCKPPRHMATLSVRGLELWAAEESVVCDGCRCTTGDGVGLVRLWQPTLWLCGRCLVEAFERMT